MFDNWKNRRGYRPQLCCVTCARHSIPSDAEVGRGRITIQMRRLSEENNGKKITNHHIKQEVTFIIRQYITNEKAQKQRGCVGTTDLQSCRRSHHRKYVVRKKVRTRWDQPSRMN